MTTAAATEQDRELELELTFPPKPEYVSTARHTVAALARLHEVPDEVVEDIKLAVSEACTNAVAANAKVGEDDPVRVVAMVEDDAMIIEVFDVAGIDPGVLDRDPEFDSEEHSFERGLSLPLLRGLVDSLDVRPREGRGAILRMRLALGDPTSSA
ncbi:MAG TPA: ATP-binding protein [Actinomycetota bacterium]|nr:ATP-binding protein [Actinomycetota bacterium]